MGIGVRGCKGMGAIFVNVLVSRKLKHQGTKGHQGSVLVERVFGAKRVGLVRDWAFP
jgi:hypothetical protein